MDVPLKGHEKTLTVSLVRYSESVQQICLALKSVSTALARWHGEYPDVLATLLIVNNSTRSDLDVSYFREILEHNEFYQYCEFKIIQGHGNIGYGSGQNLAIKKYKAEYCLLMNADVEIDESAILIGLNYLSQNRDVLIVSPLATDGSNTKIHLCKRMPTVLDFFLRGYSPDIIKDRFKNRLSYYEMHDLDESCPSTGIPITSGCFMLCRSAGIENAGYFDEGYFLYFEDFDLSLRIQLIGEIAYLPQMRIRHYGGNAAKKNIVHLLYFSISAIRFFSKYGWRWF